MDRVFSNRWFTPAFLLSMALVIVAVYSNSFETAFQYDDMPRIRDNRLLRDLGNPWVIFNNTRGFTYLTFALNYAIGGLDVTGYHAVNLAVHIVNSVLAYFLLLATFRLVKADDADSRRLSAFTALIFAVHPVQTQTVVFIVQRMESLASMFYLLALLFFIRSSRATTALKRGALYGGVGASYFLAFYSKEITYTLPAVVLLYDFFFIAKGRLRDMLGRTPLYAILAALFIYFTVTTIVPLGGFDDSIDEAAADARPAVPGADNLAGQTRAEPPRLHASPANSAYGYHLGWQVKRISTEDYVYPMQFQLLKASAADPADPADLKPLKRKAISKYGRSAGFNVPTVSPREYLYTQFNVLVYYITLLAVPANQNLDYDFPWARELLKAPPVSPGTVLNIPMPPPVVSLLILLAILGTGVYLFMRTRKNPDSRARVASFFIFWFFIILSPTSSFVPIIDAIYEHRVYLPSLGFFAVFVLALDSIMARVLPGRPGNKPAP